MHIQIINFQLKGVTEAEYQQQCDQLAPAFADLPGLLSKVWLANSATNTYGGVYTWRDRQAMEDFTRSELFKGVASDPNLDAITSNDFGILESPTRVTNGLIPTAV